MINDQFQGIAPEMANSQAVGNEQPVVQPIGREQIQGAFQILQSYRTGKANLEQRIIQNEQWYKLRHWGCLQKSGSQVEPVSGWLFNAIANKHADAMDNYPSPNILPREQGDEAQAKMLSDIVPVVLEQNDFEEVYDRVWDYKLKAGTGVYGVFWDKSKLNGLGDISIRKVDLINLFWESGISNIQQSRNLFHLELVDNEVLREQYPQLKDQLVASAVTLSQYVYDDTVDTTEKSAVIDWYYKRNRGGKTVLHYCKFVGIRCCLPRKMSPSLQIGAGMTMGCIPLCSILSLAWRAVPAALGISTWARVPRSTLIGATRRLCRICWPMPGLAISSAPTGK